MIAAGEKRVKDALKAVATLTGILNEVRAEPGKEGPDDT
jgi:hypothetical protein